MDAIDRVVRISDAMYNKGLILARDGQVFAAVEALNNALRFYKYNLAARNLLGLCYCHIGRLGDAVFHWSLSTVYEPSNNPASEYIERVRANKPALDKANQGLEIYNQALVFLNGGNVDMAVMHLKKSVELNPNLVEALVLLALCHYSTNLPDKALPYVKKALVLDRTEPRALAYYAAITGGSSPIPRVRGTGKPNLLDVQGYAKNINKRNIMTDFRITEILSFLFGCFLVLAVFWYVIMPDRDRVLKEDIETANKALTTAREAHELEKAQIYESYSDIDARIAELEASLDTAKAELSLRDRRAALDTAQEYLRRGTYEDFELAFSELVENPPDGFTVEQSQLHEELLEKASGSIELHYYNEGKAAFDKKQYDHALFYLTKSKEYTVPSSSTAHLMYYYLGRIAEQQGNNADAVTYYDMVVTKYPNSSQFKDASTRLGKLNP